MVNIMAFLKIFLLTEIITDSKISCWAEDQQKISLWFLIVWLWCHYRLVAVTSLWILKVKQKLGVSFNFDKQDVIDFTKFSKMTMCRASEPNSEK